MSELQLKAEYMGITIQEEKPRDGFFILTYEGTPKVHRYVTSAQLRHLGEIMVALANMERLGL